MVDDFTTSIRGNVSIGEMSLSALAARPEKYLARGIFCGIWKLLEKVDR